MRSVDGTVQVTPVTADLDIGFVQIPGTSSLPTTFRTKILTNEWCKSELPDPDGLGTGAGPTEKSVDMKTLHAKIGELALENDFLEGALAKAGLLSVRR